MRSSRSSDTMPRHHTRGLRCGESVDRVRFIRCDRERCFGKPFQTWLHQVILSHGKQKLPIVWDKIYRNWTTVGLTYRTKLWILPLISMVSFFLRFKGSSVPSSVSKGAPDFCSVYVISKGKVSSVRNSTRPAAYSSPLLHHIQNLTREIAKMPELAKPRLSVRGFSLSLTRFLRTFRTILACLNHNDLFNVVHSSG